MQVLTGHKNAVNTIAFMPDGTTLVSGGEDHSVRVWDLASGHTIHHFREHNAPVDVVGLSPDGQTLAVGGRRGGIYIWLLHPGGKIDVPYGARILGRARGPDQMRKFVRDLSFSADGSRLMAFLGEHLFCWETGHWKRPPDWKQPPAGSFGTQPERYCLAFAPNGCTLATSGGFGRVEQHFVHLWDASNGRRVASISRGPERYDAFPTALAFSPDSRTLAGVCNRKVRVRDVGTGADIFLHDAGRRHYQAVAFSPDGRLLAAANLDHTIRIWETGAWRLRAAYDWSIGPVHDVAFAPDGLRAAACGAGGDIVVWDLDL
jgi:WD40 repeat protein